MKIHRRVFIALTAATAALAQQQTPVYSTTTFFHVDDDKAAGFVEFSKTHTRKIAEVLVKEDPAFQAMMLTRVMYGGNPEPRSNYALTTIRRDAPAGSGRGERDALAQKAIAMSYQDYITKAASHRTRTGQTLSSQVLTSGSERAAEGDFLVYDYMKISSGRTADYIDMERTFFQPIHERLIANGAMKRWSLWTLRLPGGEDRPYDAVTAHVYKDLPSALARVRYEELAREIQPQRSMVEAVDKARSTRKRVRSELRTVVWIVARPQ